MREKIFRLPLFAFGGIPPKMKPRAGKILIIGSSGMLGVDLWQELNGSYEIIGMDVIHSRRGGLNLPYDRKARNFFRCDITNKHNIFQLVNRVRPDIVIHAAAYTDVDGCEVNPKKAYKINSDGTRNVALACRKAAALLIYISTDFVFNGKKKRPYKENDKTAPLSIYGDSKLKGEAAVKSILKKYFILRTSWLYGKCGKNFVDTIIAKGKEVKELRVVNDQVGSPTHTKDLAEAIRVLLSVIARRPKADEAISKKEIASLPAVARNDRYGIYHVTNSGSTSWFAYTKEILRLANIKTKVIPITSRELNRPAKRPAMSILDNSKFIEFTGYRMRNWRRALKSYVR